MGGSVHAGGFVQGVGRPGNEALGSARQFRHEFF